MNTWWLVETCVTNFCYLEDTLDGDVGADLVETAEVPRAFAFFDSQSSLARDDKSSAYQLCQKPLTTFLIGYFVCNAGKTV